MNHRVHVTRKVGAPRAAIAALVGSALLLAACSSAGTAGGGSPGASTPSGHAASSGSGGSPVVAADTAAIAQYEHVPTKIGITVPLKSAPPRGKTIVFLQGDLAQFKPTADGVAAGAQAIGWNFKVIPYQFANPATLVSGMQQALQYRPAYVVVGGLPEVVWSSALPAYVRAGVKIIETTAPDTNFGKTIIGNSYGPAANERQGRLGGDWMIADSNGSAHVLLVGIAGTVGSAYDSGVEQALKACSGCSVKVQNVTAAQYASGQITPTVISTLQRNPSINYVATITGAYLPGIPAALSGAGLAGKVKVVGNAPTTENLQAVRAGTEAAFTTTNLTYVGWQAVDIALRNLEGMPIQDQQGANSPTQIITKSVSFPLTADYPYPTSYPEQFKKLWHVG